MRKAHRQYRFAWLHEGAVDGDVRACSGMWLQVRVIGVEQRLCPLDSEDLCLVDLSTTPVVAASGIALRVLVAQHRAKCGQHSRAGEVFAGDQLEPATCPFELGQQDSSDFGVFGLQCGKVGSPERHVGHARKSTCGKNRGVIRRFDVCQPEELERGLAAAMATARRGELVVLPTESAYGIATDAFSAVGLAKLRQAKNRGPELPVPVMIGAAMTADGLVSGLSQDARDLMAAFWPGQLTLIGMAQPTLTWEVGAVGDESVSVRMPIHPVAWQLAKRLGPLALTGANIAGADLPLTCDEAVATFGSIVSIYLDAGPCSEPTPSTVVDVSVTPPELLREGAVTAAQLQEVCPSLVVSQ